MKIKGLKFLKIANSQGFFIPVQHTAERQGDGLQIGKDYDLEITEAR